MSSFLTATSTLASTVISSSPVVITSTFVPPPECTQNRVTMLENRGNELWLNAPQPIPSVTISSCYPEGFMSNLHQHETAFSYPAITPLVCPDMYSTVFTATSGYLACCPISYSLEQSSKPSLDRPAFGGRCYSNIKTNQTVTITAYGSTALLGTTTWQATVTGIPAYAYPLDGFRIDQATPTPVLAINSTISTAVLSPIASSDVLSTGLKKAARVVIIIACVIAGLALIATIIFGFKVVSHWKIRDASARDGRSSKRRFSKKISYPIPIEPPNAEIFVHITRLPSVRSISIYSQPQFSYKTYQPSENSLDIFDDGELEAYLFGCPKGSPKRSADKGKGVDRSDCSGSMQGSKLRPFSFVVSNPERPYWNVDASWV